MIRKNAVALYKNQCALVADVEGEKYAIQYCPSATAAGKKSYVSLKVREKDITVLHEGPASSLDAILSFSDGAISAQLSEAYELLRSDPGTASSPVPFADIARLMRPSFSADESFAVYKAISESDEFALDTASFKSGTLAFVPRSEEEIAALKQKAYEKAHEGEVRAAFVKRLKQKSSNFPATPSI